jgi:hypothetical protein
MLQRRFTLPGVFGWYCACLATSLGSSCGGSASFGATSSEATPGVSASPELSALPGPWLGSFETGLDDHEQLWLLPYERRSRLGDAIQ